MDRCCDDDGGDGVIGEFEVLGLLCEEAGVVAANWRLNSCV